MGKIFKDLRVSIEVAAGEEEFDDYVPPAGSEIGIKKFVGSAAFTQNSVCMLVWDFGGAGEEIIWSVKGSAEMPNNAARVILASETDGTKKLAIVNANGESGSLVMSSYVRFGVVTP